MSGRWLFVLSAWFVCFALRAAGGRQLDMTRVGRLGGGPPAVACRDHLVVWGMGKELQVFDTTSPGAPQLMSRTTMEDEITQAVFIGDRLCWFYSGGARLVDLSDPAAPHLYSPQPPIYFTDVAGSGTLLGVTKEGRLPDPARLELIDMSDPGQPVELGGVDLVGSEHLAFAGKLALVGYNSNGVKLHVVDVTDPGQPILSDTMEIGARLDRLHDMVSSGTTLYAAMDEGLYVFDFSQPDSPALKGVWKADPLSNHGNSISQIALAGNRACATQTRYMRVLDLTDPSTVTLLGAHSIPGFGSYLTGGIGYGNDTAYITTEHAGVLKIDVSDPRAPRLDGGYYIPGDARGVAACEGAVWLANGVAGLMGVDIGDPALPQGARLLPYEGDFPTTSVDADYGHFDAVTIRDGLAYVACWRGFSVIDVSDFAAPRQIGFWRYPSPWDIPSSRISLSGRYAVLSDTNTRTQWCPLRVLDVADPSSPTLIGMYWGPYTGVPNAVIADRFIYFLDHNTVGGGGMSLRIWELGSGGTPIERGSVEASGVALALNWPFLYVGGTVCDVSNPDAPFVCGSFFGGGVWDMFIRSPILFVAESDSDVHAFDLTDPRHPRLCGSYKMEGQYPYAPHVMDMYADDKYLYLAAQSYGFELVRYQYRAASRKWQIYE